MDIPRSSSPVSYDENEKGRGGEGDEDKTVYGSAPVSRFSTVRKRTWGKNHDVEHGADSPSENGSFAKLVHRGSTVCGYFL